MYVLCEGHISVRYRGICMDKFPAKLLYVLPVIFLGLVILRMPLFSDEVGS